MQTIFITGSTSMIGAALVPECLKEGKTVYAMVRHNSPKIARLPVHENLHLVEGYLDSLSSLPEKVPEKCDTFYHIAWGNTGARRNDSTELQAINIQYTLDAVRAAKAMGCTRFIGAGSQAEYGPKNLDVIGPETETAPVNPYGASKLAAGLLARMLCREIGMECIWPRIFSTYGIYDKESSMISSSLRKMLNGEKTSFSPAEHRWDYLFSEDAGRAFYLMGEKGKDGSIYCIGSGQGRVLREFLEEMAACCGVPVEGIGDIPYPASGRIRNLCADITNLTEDTGFVPQVSFKEGIARTVEWMRNERCYG